MQNTTAPVWFIVAAVLPVTARAGQSSAPAALPSPATLGDDAASSFARPFRLDLAALQEAAPDLPEPDKWRVDADLWIWLMGIEGDVGALGLTTSVNESFTDILDSTTSLLGLSGRIEVGHGKIAGYVDGLFTKIGIDDVTVKPEDIDINANIDFNIDLGGGPFNPNPNPNPNPDLNLGLLPGKVDITAEVSIVDFGMMYRLGEWPAGDRAPNKNLILDAYAGARYTRVSVEINPENFSSREQDEDWIDPIIGLKTRIPISDRWNVQMWGDIGGFGAASDFTWSTTAVMGYDFRMFNIASTVVGGYRALGDDYSNGSGRHKFTWDTTLHGPFLGLIMEF